MMDCWTDFPLPLAEDDVLRGEGADPASVRSRRPVLLEAARAALQLGLPALRPVAIVREIRVTGVRHERLLLEGGAALTGPHVMRFLVGAEKVAAAVCSIGPVLEQTVSARMDEDPVLALALDGLGNAAVENVGQQVCERIARRAEEIGLTASTPLSPGDSEWPVDVGQPQIFALLDTSQAGVRLGESGMMLPRKTVSFVVAIGLHIERVDPCELCNLKDRCHYRHA